MNKVYLTHTDPAQNMARYYTMRLQATLVGGMVACARVGQDRPRRPGEDDALPGRERGSSRTLPAMLRQAAQGL